MLSFVPMTILVTGGASGIGLAVARHLSDRRHVVLSCDIAHDAPAIPASPSPSEPVIRARMDVTRDREVDDLFRWAQTALPPLSAVVHCAGIGIFRPLLELTASDWQRLFEVNVHGAFRISRAAALAMQSQGGRIVHLGSLANRQALPGSAAYGASKAALQLLCQSLNLELAGSRIRTTFLTLGAVATPLWQGRSEFDPSDMLSPAQIAGTICDIVETPLDVRIDEMSILPPKGIL